MTTRWQETEYYAALPNWKKALLEAPDAFILKYFPRRIQLLKDFHLRLITACVESNRSLNLFPAGHGKTTISSTLLPVLHVCRNPDVRIAIIGKNDTEVEGIMRAIQSEMTENDELVADFGPFQPVNPNHAWSLGRMDVRHRTRRGKEATIAAFGSNAKTTLGYRTDITICDDVVTQDNSATPTQREKLKNWFDLCVETGPEYDDSQLVVTGTRFDPNDLYGDLLLLTDPELDEKTWNTLLVDAIVPPDDSHQPLWPEVWSWQRLMRKKSSIGTLSFNKRYRNQAVDESSLIVREAWVRGGYDRGHQYQGCLDRDYTVGDFEDSWRIISGFDPAGGVSRHSKFCAHVTLGLGSCADHERCLWLIDLERDQMTLPQQVDQIISKHQQYTARVSVIEANAFQVALYQAVKQRLEEQGIALTIEPHYTNRTNKPDPDRGVEAMSPWFENGWVHIPWGDARSQRKMTQFVDELCLYAGKDSSRTTDTVMAFWFAWLKLQLHTPVYQPFNRLAKTHPRPWAPIQGRFIQNPYYADTREAV